MIWYTSMLISHSNLINCGETYVRLKLEKFDKFKVESDDQWWSNLFEHCKWLISNLNLDSSVN